MQSKNCFELYRGYKTIKQIFLKYLGLQVAPWQCQAILLGCLGASLTRCAGQSQRILKTAEIGEKCSVYEEPLHPRSYLLDFNLKIQYLKSCINFYLFQSCSKVFAGCNCDFQSCCLLNLSKTTG